MKDLSYKALDIVTLGRGVKRRIGTESVRFPARWSRYYEQEYEPDTFRFLKRSLRPGSVMMDIGAHIGLFSVVAAKVVGASGKVYSFEPTPFTRSVLSEVVELNGFSNVVEIRPEAVSDKPGVTTFFDTGDVISNANSLVKTFRSREGIEVPVTSVDEFVGAKGITVSCLKIDVEGAELDLLKGARETLMSMRPAVRLGLHPPAITDNGQSLDEIWSLLDEYGLTPEFDGEVVDREWFCGQREIFDVNLSRN
jgi:FkbM family methyltransferase